MEIIELKNINKYYYMGENSLHVLKDVSLTVEKGEYLAILGPSGSGKSTLMNIIGCMDVSDEGEYYLDGESVHDAEEEDLTNIRNEKIGFIFQKYHLIPTYNVLQNIVMPLLMRGMTLKEAHEQSIETIEMLGLADRIDHKPSELSGGQQQRVALARAIVAKPKVLLLDEPLSAIDAKLRKNLQIEIRRIQKALNITTIFVTHDQDEAMLMSDRVCLINRGQIEQIGSPVEIYTNPKTKFAASFIGHYNVLSDIEFSKAFMTSIDENSVMAIRPETILLSHERKNRPDSYEFEGVVKESRSVGNVLRYHVEVNGIDMRADTLYRSFSLYQDGDKVWVSVEKRNCLELTD